MWEALGSALGGILVGAIGTWKKKNAEVKKVADTLDEIADATMTSVVDNMTARALAIADRFSETTSARLGPGTVLGDLEAKRKEALADVERLRQEAINDFRRGMAAARAATIPSEKRETKPERIPP